MCFAQISFPIDVVHITMIRPLVLIQMLVLQFLFNLKLNKSRELLEGAEMPSPVELWQPSWNCCDSETASHWATQPLCSAAGIIWIGAEPGSAWAAWRRLPVCQRTGSSNLSISALFGRDIATLMCTIAWSWKSLNQANVATVCRYNIKLHPRAHVTMKTTALVSPGFAVNVVAHSIVHQCSFLAFK